MKAFMTAVLTSIVLTVAASSAFAANSYPDYDMYGIATEIWNGDTQYFSPPIELYRSKDTNDRHQIRFEAMKYEEVCRDWQYVCVGYDALGNCIGWAYQCTYWELKSDPITKIIELNFSEMPDLVGNEEETYLLSISRNKPYGEGEDWVITGLEATSTKVPANVVRFDDFSYRIRPQP